jgi:phosphotransacetylase
MTFDALEMKKKSLKAVSDEIDCFSEKLIQETMDMKKLEETWKTQMEELKVTEENIKLLKLQMEDCVVGLKKMNEKKKRINEMIKNVNLIGVIVVDDERNNYLRNGLVDLNRDTLMNLLRIIQNEKKTRIVYLLSFVQFYKHELLFS